MPHLDRAAAPRNAAPTTALATARATALVLALAVLPGCALFERPAPPPAPPAPPPAPVEQPPLVSDRFVIEEGNDVVGQVQVIRARYEDTFVDIGRAYDLGYDELVEANPGVDPWLPGEGTLIVLPTQFILPPAPREGIVLNVGAKRIFYYPKTAPGAPRVIVTHPVGIGRENWNTPVGVTKVVAKVRNPVWVVPPSIRKEHAEAGDPLPARVPSGPNNPLGYYALRLGFDGYLIHGTNKPAGIGMRVSHGCVQLFPEDIESLWGEVPVGTPVRIVNEPLLLGWQQGNLFLEVHPPLEDDKRKPGQTFSQDLKKALARGPATGVQVDMGLVATARAEARGYPIPVLQPAADARSVVARARLTRNVVGTAGEDGPAAAAPVRGN